MKTKKMLSFFLCFAMMLGVMPCTAAEGVEQLYLHEDEGVYLTKMEIYTGASVTLFLVVDTLEGTKASVGTDYQVSCTEALGTITINEKNRFVWTAAESPAEGQIFAVKDGVTYAMDAAVLSADPEEPEQPPQNYDDPVGEITGSHETTEDDLCTETGWLENRGKSAVAEFELDGKTYYMGVGLHGETYPRPGSATSPSLEINEIRMNYFDIGFYVALAGEEEYARIVDVDLLADIEQAFGDTLRLEVKGLDYEDEDISYTAPDVMPAMHRARGDERCFECTILELGKENWGNYAISGYGEVNGEEISVHTTYGWKPAELNIFRPGEDDPIGEINEYLASLDAGTGGNLEIYMPEGTFAGYITVPDKLSRLGITIFGAPKDNRGRPTTKIQGGVQAEGFSVTVMDITFLGANSGEEGGPWADGTVENIALLGGGFIRANNCRFEGYDIAMCGRGALKFGNGNVFVENEIAVLLDAEEERHDITSLKNSVFLLNGTALVLEQVPDSFAMSDLDLSGCSFVDNDVDIFNKLQRNLYLPGCYFAAPNEEGEEVVRECQYRPIAEGNVRKNVLYYPQAVTAEFKEFLYDTSFYHHKPVVSVDFTKTFPIPVVALDGAEFTVMKGDTELARITYEAAEEGQSLSLLGGSDETFDATVQVEREEERIEITLQAIPAGKAPVISVPCDAGWVAVAVTDPEGEPLEGTVANGYASFAACTGGTYVIERVTPPLQYHIDSLALLSETGEPLAELPAGKCSVKVRVTNVASAGDVLVMAGLYAADGQYLGLTAQPVENLVLNDSREVALPVDNTDNKIADLTVFVVTSLADPVPLSDSRPLLP